MSILMPMLETAGRANLDLEDLYREHQGMVIRAAYRVTGNASDAEDVLQTVFLRLARSAPGEDIGSIKSYLYRAAVNAALDVLRRRQESRIQAMEDGQEFAAPAMSDEVESREIRENLRRALAKLNPRHAEMFVLRYLEEMDNKEIARMMQTSQAVVAVTLHRTRHQLKKEFTHYRKARS